MSHSLLETQTTAAPPRLRGRFALALVVTVAVAATALGVHLWDDHTRAAQQRTQLQAQRAYTHADAAFIAGYRFPAGIVREPASYWDLCSTGPCGHSELPPYELGPRLARSVGHGKIFTGFSPAHCRLTPLCTVTAFGHFRGYTTFAIAYWHVIYTRTPRRAPPGATDYRHLGRIFMLGSDVSIGMSQPNSLD